MRSPLPFPCVPDRPYKILLVQVGTLSFSHPSFGVPVLFIHLYLNQYYFFAWGGQHDEIWKNLTGPCPAPTYLPTYLPYLWETKKEITGGVKVGYYTNLSDDWWYSPATTVLPVTWQATLKPYKHHHQI